VPAYFEEVKQAMGEWLGGLPQLRQLPPWGVFATYTFAGPHRRADAPIWGALRSRWRGVSPAGALYWGRRHLNHLESLVNGWCPDPPSAKNAWGYVEDSYLDLARTRVYAFLGVERGETGGLVHLHALVGNVGRLRAFCGNRLAPGQWGRDCCMVHAWPCGYARVLPYDPKLGAKFYVSKYLTKRLAEWELIGFPATPQFSS
jgi:hypothetical protein